jgi:hypothetical protein
MVAAASSQDCRAGLGDSRRPGRTEFRSPNEHSESLGRPGLRIALDQRVSAVVSRQRQRRIPGGRLETSAQVGQAACVGLRIGSVLPVRNGTASPGTTLGRRRGTHGGIAHDSIVITTATSSTGSSNSADQRSISGDQCRTDSGRAGGLKSPRSAQARLRQGRVAELGCDPAQTIVAASARLSKEGMATAGRREAAGGRARRGKAGGDAPAFVRARSPAGMLAARYGSGMMVIALPASARPLA